MVLLRHRMSQWMTKEFLGKGRRGALSFWLCRSELFYDFPADCFTFGIAFGLGRGDYGNNLFFFKSDEVVLFH